MLPHPWLWRWLFFSPLFTVELCTIALFLAVPGVRVTSWTVAALAGLFFILTLWSSIGFGYPDHVLPHAANVVSKVCAFVVTMTMLLPSERRTVEHHVGERGQDLNLRPAWRDRGSGLPGTG